MERTPKFAVAILSSIVIMFLLPWATVHLASADAGMALCFLLFFAINPLFSLALGLYSGLNFSGRWSLPLLSALAFLFSAWFLFDMGEPAFIGYAGAYLLLGAVTMVPTTLSRRRRA